MKLMGYYGLLALTLTLTDHIPGFNPQITLKSFAMPLILNFSVLHGRRGKSLRIHILDKLLFRHNSKTIGDRKILFSDL
jgi:hypothetical protein